MTQTRPPAGERDPVADDEQRVGDYRLLALIGEGGMGVVHLARGADGRRVALKVLRPYVVGDAEARERLAREVSSLRRVSSPRVAEVLDADPHGPTPYVATRYVPGLSLHEHVREEGPVEGADLLHFAICLAEALLAVHAVGVLHRDIKPSNVLMEGRSPVLIDFGLARLAEDPRLTHTGWLLGTPGYLAPEILYGDDASPASDVHSWAATVAFAATGRPPYGKGPAMAVMDRVRRGEHDLSGVPAPLAGLLGQALAADPLDRPGLHEIEVWLRGQRAALAAGTAHPTPESTALEQAWTRPVVALDRPAPTVVGGGDARPADPVAPPRYDPDPFDHVTVPEPARAPDPVPPEPAEPAPHTRMLQQDPLPPGIVPVEPNGSPAQRRAGLLGLGAALAAAVAAAPYAAVLLVGLVVLLLRTVSIGRERHARRRTIRGRARWFDVPTTTLASPGYVVLALLGSVLLLGWAVSAGVAVGVLAAVAGPPLGVGMLLLGVAFTVALWWGPGSLRLREMVAGGVAAAARREFAGLVLIGLSVVLALVLGALVLGGGPNWTPAMDAPWSSGFLADVAGYL